MTTDYCKKPDRDVPGLECGYPFPCPWHTVIIDTTRDPITVTAPDTNKITRGTRKRLVEIGKAVKP